MPLLLMEQYLTEDIDAVKNLPQFKDIPEDIFEDIIRIDPTFKEGKNNVGKYGKWLLTLYKKDNIFNRSLNASNEIKDHIISTVKYMITKYDNLKNDRTKEIEKDIMKFKTLQQMQDAIDNVKEAELTSRQQSRQDKKNKDYDMVFEGDIYAVFVPRNHAGDMALASFGGSSKAKWCTAADSEDGKWNYDKYLQSGGKYYVLINKNNYNEKYQFHFQTNQFLNQNNKMGDNFLIPVIQADPKLWKFFYKEGYKLKIGDDPQKPIKIPKECIDGAILLSKEQAENLLTKEQRLLGKSWWLRSPGDVDYAAWFVEDQGDTFYAKDLPEIWNSVVTKKDVRPALQIHSDKSFTPNVGDKLKLGGYPFTIISNRLAICDKSIGICKFNNSELDGNDYKTSDIKEYVDSWFDKAYNEYNDETNVNESYHRIRMKEI